MNNDWKKYWPAELKDFSHGDTVRCGSTYGILMHDNCDINFYFDVYDFVCILHEEEHLVYYRKGVAKHIKLEPKRILLIECINFGLGKQVFK